MVPVLVVAALDVEADFSFAFRSLHADHAREQLAGGGVRLARPAPDDEPIVGGEVLQPMLLAVKRVCSSTTIVYLPSSAFAARLPLATDIANPPAPAATNSPWITILFAIRQACLP